MPCLAGALSWVVVGLLSVFTLRRFVMIVAAALPARVFEPGPQPRVAVIASFLNEEENLPGLLEALDGLEYPRERIYFTLVDDCSRDATTRILESWVSRRSNARCLVLAQTAGKAEGLRHALSASPESELVAVYDADLRPLPGSLRILAGAFSDERIGAVAGFRRPSNTSASLVAAYGSLESLVHQLITQAGKDRLGLNPTTMGGNCVYRRSALQQAGGFPAGAFSEDIEISLALVAAGWRTRFCRDAVAQSTVVESLRRYWNQRSRWTRGLYRSRRRASRLESWLVSAGYADRLVFLATLVLAAHGQISVFWPALYCLAPVASAASALYRAGLGPGLTARVLLSSPPMFVVDVAVTLVATINALLGRRQQWHTGGASK
jgi:cellulose synthase/poly-beta-1,6-N-acetylglucosamine synthase-like glycosyltransferase